MTQPYKKKLIEVAIPLEAINAASAREKSIRHGHPSTLHLWWARRPLAACRAVLFAQLVDDPSSLPDEFPTEELQDAERKRLFAIIEDLVKWENSTNEEVLERARAEIRRSYGGVLPPVYDPFSGGGSIPLEAQRLGLPAYGSDLNPVAVMIGKAMIEIPPKFKDQKPIHPGIKARNHYRNAEGLAEDVLFFAKAISEKAWAKIGHLYPKVTLAKRDGGSEGTVLAWLWARTVSSPNPAMSGAQVPLISSYWLCKKEKKQTWVLPNVQGTSVTFEVGYGKPPNVELVDAGTKAGRGANFRCILTGDAITSEYVKSEGMAGRMGWQLMAIVAEGAKGRVYVSPSIEQQKVAFSCKPTWRPEFPLSQHPQYMSVTNYGPTNISDLFMDRQTIALNTFIDLIPDVLAEVSASDEYKKALATYLALSVSRLANRQSTSTFWDNGAEKIQQVFAMQALPMRWDTAEGNPFSTSTGNFMGQVEYLAKNVAALPAWGGPGHLDQLNAQSVNFEGKVISTDPPYYDNVPYADLSDFFYVWLRKALRDHYPSLFETMLVPKAEELVADHKRHNGKDAADTFFLDGMTVVMRHMAEQGRPDTPATIYYAFRQGEVGEGGLSSKGWATFLQAVIAAGFQIGATWPVRTELVGNLKKNKNALATSVVLSCRPRTAGAETVSKSEFIRALKRELPAAMREMQRANIAPVDMPQASIGPGVGIFSRYAAVIESDDSAMSVKSALQIINLQLDEFLSEQEGVFDPDTRFAVTWYTQNGYGLGPFGDADNLARARGISVDDVKHAGIVESAAGKVRILKRDELDVEWEPETDTHLTVWECCQHLVRLHEKHGIGYETAVMLKKFGSDKAEAVKDLAYILYDLCANKRQDAKEATAYNALIADWSDLTREAAVAPLSNRSGQSRFDI
ncbi:DUF1156 domain-containing protein [Yoonia sp.]|uniref:DUF1156 domain-containing protein n=1 Tax=Yoonia sp. TaxID=2212373 RepID=UPI0040488132